MQYGFHFIPGEMLSVFYTLSIRPLEFKTNGKSTVGIDWISFYLCVKQAQVKEPICATKQINEKNEKVQVGVGVSKNQSSWL